MKKCQAHVVLGGPICKRVGIGNPPVCAKHAAVLDEIDEDEDAPGFNFNPQDAQVLINSILENPKVRKALGSATSFFSKLSGVLTTAQATAGAPQDKGASAPPPRQPHQPRDRVKVARTVMGFDEKTVLTVEMIKERRKHLAAMFHPDKGGSPEAMKRLNVAADILLKEVVK